MKTSDLWNRFIAATYNDKRMNFSYSDFDKAVKQLVITELNKLKQATCENNR